jgi:hypothetical protein
MLSIFQKDEDQDDSQKINLLNIKNKNIHKVNYQELTYIYRAGGIETITTYNEDKYKQVEQNPLYIMESGI